MRFRIQILALAVYVTLASLAGCRSNMVLRVTATDDSDIPTPTKVRTTTYWWGLMQHINLRTPEGCGSICKVETSTNFGDIVVSFITLGIIVPQTLQYSCCPDDPLPEDN